MIRRVVFNADDFGASEPENACVLALAETRIVREVSVIVTSESARQAFSMLRSTELEIGVGLHFSLTQGRALTGRIPGLTDTAGRFSSLGQVLLRAFARTIDSRLVERELRAQFEQLTSLGIVPTHLNGHHHVHLFPGVREAVIRVLHDFPNLHVRVPLEAPGLRPTPRWAMITAMAVRFSKRATHELAHFHRLPCVGMRLYSAADHGRAFERLGRELRVPAAEWIVHPRPQERRTLTDQKTRELLEELQILPSRYSDLSDPLAAESS